MIDERGIEIGVSGLHEDVDHLLELRHVDALLAVWIKKGKPHAAKSHLRFWHDIAHRMHLSAVVEQDDRLVAWKRDRPFGSEGCRSIVLLKPRSKSRSERILGAKCRSGQDGMLQVRLV